MEKATTSLIVSFILIVVFLLTTGTYATDDRIKISPKELKEILDQPGITVVDVRIVSDWRKSKRKITGAVREDPHNVSSWAGKYSEEDPLVVYCS